MMVEHGFWLVLSVGCVIWYATITVYVAVKGLRDIRQMLSRLSVGSDHDS
jgi:hypothetical protein